MLRTSVSDDAGGGVGFLSHLRSLRATMSQKSSVPQAVSFVSQVLKRDTRYEKPEWSEREFLQGIAGTLELFHLSTVRFQNIVGEASGHPVVVYQRIDQAGQRLPLDDQVLGDTDTMMIFGLDHMITEQEASPAEIEAVRKFLTREGTCLMIGPHHDVGVSSDPAERQMEYAHHGDPLVPRQQRFGPFPHEGTGRACEKSMDRAERGWQRQIRSLR